MVEGGSRQRRPGHEERGQGWSRSRTGDLLDYTGGCSGGCQGWIPAWRRRGLRGASFPRGPQSQRLQCSSSLLLLIEGEWVCCCKELEFGVRLN